MTRKRQTAAEREYPEGYFLEPVYAWFGDDWKPQIKFINDRGKLKPVAEMNSREQGLAKNQDWAKGFLGKLSSSADKIDLSNWRKQSKFNPKMRNEG